MKKYFIFLFCTCFYFFITPSLASAFVTDDFSSGDIYENGWEQIILLGNPDGEFIMPERNRLAFHLPNYDTYIYLVNQNSFGSDVSVEGSFENINAVSGAIGLVCRYHDYGWYEFRVNIAGPDAGSYVMYKYDQYLKTQHKNPYVTLHKGMDRYYSNDINLGLNKSNDLKLICEDDEFRIFINGIEEKPIKIGKMHDSDFSDGLSGFLIHGYKGGTSQIDITSFDASVAN